jgi:DNA-binding XRE family transcriptional regulator
MTAGLPGLGLSGLFLVVAALAAPLAALRRRLLSRSDVRARASLRLAAVGFGVIALSAMSLFVWRAVVRVAHGRPAAAASVVATKAPGMHAPSLNLSMWALALPGALLVVFFGVSYLAGRGAHPHTTPLPAPVALRARPGVDGAELRSARRASGLTQRQLAELAGTSRTALGRVERSAPGAGSGELAGAYLRVLTSGASASSS